MNKREAILEAALKLLAEKGVHNTPISAIAKEAGTGMGTIYNYFPNKEQLINELYLEIKGQEQQLFDAFDSSKPIRTQFEVYYSAIVHFFMQHPLYFKFIEQLQASPLIWAETRVEAGKTMLPVHQLVLKGQEDRIIKNINPDELLMFVGGAVLSYLRWYFNQEKNAKVQLATQIQLVWDAIKQ